MAGSDETAGSRLHQIAGVLGIPVEAFSNGGMSNDNASLNELLNLYLRLRTAAGRAAVLNAVRQISDQEGEAQP